MKYRKKPIIVDAEQFFPDKKPWPEGVYRIGGELEGDDGESWNRIDTLEGPKSVRPGDWIITGTNGEKYPCKPDIFEATYEALRK